MNKNSIIMSNSTWKSIETLAKLSPSCALEYIAERMCVLTDKEFEKEYTKAMPTSEINPGEPF